MKKILICISSLSRTNGIASFIMNYYQKIVENRYILDFFLVLPNVKSDEKYIKTIEQNNGKIYYALPHNALNRFSVTKNRISQILKQSDYDIVHVNLIDIYAYACIKGAKNKGVKKIIYHVHNPKVKTKLGKISDILNFKCIKYSNKLVACSKSAGDSMFKDNKFTVVKNCIDVEKYKFDKEARLKYRKEYGLDKSLVIGVVARIIEQKNPFFIMDILFEIKKEYNNVKLIWAGVGPLKNELEKYIEKLSLKENVVLLGDRDNVERLYSAMDVFLLPSKYEGLGIVFLESQANGLLTFSSDNVPEDTKVTSLIKYLPLEQSAQIWKEEILKSIKKNNFREDKKYIQLISDAGYNSKNNNSDLFNIYN